MKADKFKEKAITKHGSLYDYSLVTDTVNIKDFYQIICLIHSIFKQRGDSHLQGVGCGKCKKSVLKTVDEFISEAKILYKNYYNYDSVNYIRCKTKVDIICPEHGIFQQTPDSHLSGHGCSKCAFDINSKNMKNIARNEFTEKANKIHKNKYSYEKAIYINAKEKSIITCLIHGDFEQTPNDHLCGKGCPKCGINLSFGENEVNEFIVNELKLKTDKIRINNKEIDIYIPSHNLGIEYNGLYFHSSFFRENSYHLNKTELCEKNNIQLLHLFEDEWTNKKDIVKSIIKSKLGVIDSKIFARKCIIKEVSNKESHEFLDNNHLQGYVGSNYKIGLYYNEELVSLMTFGKKRRSMGNKIVIDGEYEMLRFCNKLNIRVIGGASKLYNYFKNTYFPISIITFANKRYSNGNLYKQLKFDFVSETTPNYWYVIGKTRKHRFLYRKDVLVSEGYDPTKSEHKIMLERKIPRIYDCGNIKFIDNNN